jgi:ABC-type oligopeptide transport system ATPase subunit
MKQSIELKGITKTFSVSAARSALCQVMTQSVISEVLDSVGHRPGSSFLDMFPFELSGGRRQCVAIARAGLSARLSHR